MALSETLAAQRDRVMERWKEQVRGEFAPEAIPQLELVDHIPLFLDAIVEALQAAAGEGGAAAPTRRIAANHGAQRLRLGFSLEAVVGEYGALRNAIVCIAQEAGAPPTAIELQTLFDLMVSGIAHAVSEYSQQRDAELRRQANEHFAFIAHELRNPLSSALAALQLLKAKGQLTATDRSAGALERGLRRTADLINETLEIARVASGIELKRRATTLQALFASALEDSALEAEAKGVDIRVTVTSDAALRVDVRLVASAVGNLLRNAVKYTADHSAVQLRGSVTDDRVVIEVEDRCGGLAPGKVEEAFSPFVRFDNHEDGFGLGLAIAKQAVEAHGGVTRVQNLPGKGCIFVLEFPALRDG